nr:TetR/AcrR family transcriptional regulator [Mycobacterium sp. OAS707]
MLTPVCCGPEACRHSFPDCWIEAVVTDQTDRRADSARAPLVRAAAQQFAHKPYSLVNLDDVVAAVDVTRGGMYFHFPSKQALAIAVIDEADKLGREAAAGVLASKLSGLETLIDLSYLVAVLDLSDEMARAGLYLLESIGRADGIEERSLRELVNALSQIARRAVDEGDIAAGRDPDDVARLLVSMYIGVRHTSDLDAPRQFLLDIEKAWNLLLPGFANPERMGYFQQFVHRRTAVALGKMTPPNC